MINMNESEKHLSIGSCILSEWVSRNVEQSGDIAVYVDNNMSPNIVVPSAGSATITPYTHKNFGWQSDVNDTIIVEELATHFTSPVVFTADEGTDFRDAA